MSSVGLSATVSSLASFTGSADLYQIFRLLFREALLLRGQDFSFVLPFVGGSYGQKRKRIWVVKTVYSAAVTRDQYGNGSFHLAQR